jgi:fused signal recognition particle receptor
MAFGFVKKIFSFGRKQVEETPGPDDARAQPAPDMETKAPESAPAAPPPAEPAPEIPPAMAEPEHEPAKPEPTPGPAPTPVPEPWPEPVPEPTPEPKKPPEEVPPAPQETPAAPPAPPLEVPPPAEPAPEPTRPEEIPPRASAPHPLPASGERGASTLEPSTPVDNASAAHVDGAFTPPSPRPSWGEGKGEGSAPTQPAPSSAKVTVAKTVARKAEPAPAATAPAPAARVPWLQRLRQGLSRSSRELTSSISGVFTKRRLDEDTLQDLEDVLIRADLGMETAIRVTDALSSGRFGRDISDTEVRAVIASEMEKVLSPVALPLELDLSHKPHVILVVGVNGTGKTTTIGKLAAKLREGGLSVMLAAGDTFRAAAIEQLKIWGERTGSPVVSSKLGADAAGLAFDAWQQAKAAGSDVLIIDTAGRLHNKAELMAELEKIVRVLGKHDPEAPHTVLQTVDATTGQNALSQVEIFRNVAGVNGLVMTKLDGTARGGILVAIAAKHRLPVYFIGVGEQVDDLEPFSAGDFAKAIAGVE